MIETSDIPVNVWRRHRARKTELGSRLVKFLCWRLLCAHCGDLRLMAAAHNTAPTVCPDCDRELVDVEVIGRGKTRRALPIHQQWEGRLAR
jgi:hypothetical protein